MTEPSGANLKNRVILVGIGGATCSGKTTLAKHLRRVLPNCEIIHQDDFAPPQDLIPIHPKYNVQDWDSPHGAIDWPRLSSFLRHVKETDGGFPKDHYSHDHLNEQKEVAVADATRTKLRAMFEQIEREHRERGERVIWRLLDGFLLYWNKDVVASLDVRIFLRVPTDVLKQRRHERHGYHTAEGSLWRDPPHYWEQIVWPGYVEAHEGMFEDGDVEHGAPRAPTEGSPGNGDDEGVRGLVLVEGLQTTMEETLERCCKALQDCVQS